MVFCPEHPKDQTLKFTAPKREDEDLRPFHVGAPPPPRPELLVALWVNKFGNLQFSLQRTETNTKFHPRKIICLDRF